jgi:hypothetical protein
LKTGGDGTQFNSGDVGMQRNAAASHGNDAGNGMVQPQSVPHQRGDGGIQWKRAANGWNGAVNGKVQLPPAPQQARQANSVTHPHGSPGHLEYLPMKAGPTKQQPRIVEPPPKQQATPLAEAPKASAAQQWRHVPPPWIADEAEKRASALDPKNQGLQQELKTSQQHAGSAPKAQQQLEPMHGQMQQQQGHMCYPLQDAAQLHQLWRTIQQLEPTHQPQQDNQLRELHQQLQAANANAQTAEANAAIAQQELERLRSEVEKACISKQAAEERAQKSAHDLTQLRSKLYTVQTWQSPLFESLRTAFDAATKLQNTLGQAHEQASDLAETARSRSPGRRQREGTRAADTDFNDVTA